PSGRKLVTAGADNRGRIWDLSAFEGVLPPSELETLIAKGKEQRAVKDLAGQRATLEEAARRFPGAAEAHIQLGLSWMGDDMPRLVREFEAALKLAPEDADANYWVGSL